MRRTNLLVVLALLVALLPGTASRAALGDRSAAGDALDRALRAGRLTKAQFVLERATSLFRLDEVRARFGEVHKPAPHEATMVLRDLATTMDDLSRTDRLRAEALLARPTDDGADPEGNGYVNNATVQYYCDPLFCLYWDTAGSDAVPMTDVVPAGGNGFPDQVDTAYDMLVEVWNKEVNSYGYNPPLSDADSGINPNPTTPNPQVPFWNPTPAFDLFMTDLGDDGLYGYCATDDPDAPISNQVSAYCVMDNDFSAAQYSPDVSGLAALKVTLAHEFFHAIQFGYDVNESKWLMEGTAAWMEDEVYDSVNSNYEYLFDSQLHQPEVPLDAYSALGDEEDFEYGAWIFWRFLDEFFGNRNVIRSVWVNARTMSTRQAVNSATSARGLTLPRTYLNFAVWNQLPRSYEEGASYMLHLENAYAPWDATFVLSRGQRSTGSKKLYADHLSARYVLIEPQNTPSDSRLRVNLDIPSRSRGADAAIIILHGSCAKAFRFTLDSAGRGAITVPFGSAKCGGSRRRVTEIWLVLSNGGTYDGQPFAYKAVMLT